VNVAACPACGNKSVQTGHAIISPWIRQRIAAKATKSTFHVCLDCGTGFFSYRFSPSEMKLLYADYRGSRYHGQRQAWEPTYSLALNNDLGSDESVVAMRQQELVDALSASHGWESGNLHQRPVVDIGGDRGQFIPTIFEEKFVLEVSGREPVCGVRTISELSELIDLDPGLVMACGLLEHLSDPGRFLSDITSVCRSGRQTLVYIEVPSGVPVPGLRGSSAVINSVGVVGSRNRTIWRILDRASAYWRRTRNYDFPLSPLRQSEHLNFFTQAGLESLIQLSGGQPILLNEYTMPTQLTQSGRLAFSEVIRALYSINAK